MHGRNRAEHNLRLAQPAFTAALEKKVGNYNKLVAACTARLTQFRENFTMNGTEHVPPSLPADEIASTLELIATVLSINSDYYTMWNFRRDLLASVIHHTAAFPLPALEGELKTTEQCLKKSPKSYPAFHHRKHVIDLYLSHNPTAGGTLLPVELELTNTFLMSDARNFHCLNYRRFLLQCITKLPHETFGTQLGRARYIPTAGPDSSTYSSAITTEWQFTHELISANFSNGSAYHYRAALFPLVCELEGGGELERIGKVKEELEMCQEAYFVQPEDQSPWYYHEFLLSFMNPTTMEGKRRYVEIIMDETVGLRELIGEGGSGKLPLIALYGCLWRLEKVIGDGELGNDASELLKVLESVDGDKGERYSDLRRREKVDMCQLLFAYGATGGSDVALVELKRARFKKMDVTLYVSWFLIEKGVARRLTFGAWDQQKGVRGFKEGVLTANETTMEWVGADGMVVGLAKKGECSEETVFKCSQCWPMEILKNE